MYISYNSSVTAGHDSHFNYSTPVVTGELMEDSFKSLNIKLDSRNVALGSIIYLSYYYIIILFIE